MDTYKLQLKVGVHEFFAEGPSEEVRRDFEIWKQMIRESPGLETAPPIATESTVTNGAEPVNPDWLGRLYIVDEKRGSVTLRILPRSTERNADALLLTLLGYQTALNTAEVAVTSLRSALRQSGCTIDRVDSVAARNLRNGFINKGGRGKGGKYSLTNAGTDRARSIASTLLNS